MYWVDLLNIIIVSLGLAVSIIGLVLSSLSIFADSFSKRFFIAMFITLILYSGCALGSNIALLYPGHPYTAASVMFVFCESLFSSTAMPMLTLYFLLSCNKRSYNHPLFITALVLWLLYFAMLVFNLKTGVFYYFTADNVYHRGEYYPLLLFPPVLLMLINLIAVIRFHKMLSVRNRIAFSIYLAIPIICMVIQMIFYGILAIVLGTSISTFTMLIFIILEHRKMMKKQEAELLLFQVRPHFIYNTLTHIYYLCDSDPGAAQEVIGSFTTYLRKNFSAINSSSLSTFDEELEHTKAFLSVIKARYGDLINIEYVIRNTDFRLPPLTLEPIVENAVKHGVDPEYDALNIKIISENKDKMNIITVINSGPAFKPAEDGTVHVGLDNVRKRLNILCGGTITITQGEDGTGAVVMISVPQM